MFYGDLLVNKVIWQRSINSHLHSPEMSFGGRERLRNEVDVPNPQFVTLCTRAARVSCSTDVWWSKTFNLHYYLEEAFAYTGLE